MISNGWNRCCYCGRFISYTDYDIGAAFNEEVTPDSAYTREEWHSYHLKCYEKNDHN